MRLDSIAGNWQRLDGGAMFGNCPRTLWARWCAPDAENRIRLACRGLLVREDSGRTVLLETGVGSFFEPKLRARYGVEPGHHVLLTSLQALGVAPERVDVIVLSHLHFDHAGGLLTAWQDGEAPRLAFENANYVVSEAAYQRALAPHPRDRASFIAELPALLEQTGRLELTRGPRSQTLGDRYRLTYSDGHTPGMLLTTVDADEGPITFMADLVPGVPWAHVPITMGYDRFPERLIEEKAAVLAEIHRAGGRLFFTHDPEVAVGRLSLDDRGRYLVTDAQPELRA
ncbi:MAG: MBL fold metallo-hydrolase [Myxococcales bacterium FL481]|nr:MAG: MBL fold metallo-hydrolase [Myxococcales bacterium FL481]